MNRTLRVLVAIVGGMLLGITVGFLLVPDPTGFGALLAGPALGLVFTVALYLQLGDEDDSTTTA